MSPRVLRRRVLTGLLLLAMLWGVAAIWSSVVGVRAALQGRDTLEQLIDEHPAHEIARGRADDELAASRDHLRTAADHLGSWRLAPVRVLPFVGRQVKSGAALSGAGAEMLDIALELTAEVTVLSDGLESGEIGIEDGLAQLAPPLVELRSRAAAIELGPSAALVGVLGRARDEAQLRQRELVDNLAKASDGARGFASFLEGPSRYLLFAANTSQMRGGVGGLLSVGVVEVEDGNIWVSEVASVSDVPLPSSRVPLDADLEARWGWNDPNDAWSNLGNSPRFDVTAATAAAMWEGIGRGEVDGVLAVDPVALSAVLQATGPVRIEEQTYGAQALLDYLAHGQYVDLTEDIYEDWETYAIAQAERRDHLAAIAAQAMVSITADDVDALDVLIQLADAASGRHLLFWSRDELQQAAWRAAGVSGELEADSMLLSLVNRGGTKADYYVTMDSEISFERVDDHTEVVVEVEITNNIPFGEPRYVAGPHPELAETLAYGDYLGIVTLNLPAWATNGRVDGDNNLAIAGADGPTRVVGSWVTVQRDTTESRVFRFELPAELEQLTVEASARFPVSRWRHGGDTFADDSPRTLSW